MSDDQVLVSRDDLEALRKVWLYLDGQAELDGCVYGERPIGRAGFWWRKELRQAFEAVYQSPVAQPSDGALANDGAEPVALADAFGEWFKRNPYEELTHATLGYMAFKAGAVWLSTQRPPVPTSSTPKTCTCPSGDGSLRWPCPVHPPVARDVILHEQIMEIRRQYERANFVQVGKLLNACLDRVKELNS